LLSFAAICEYLFRKASLGVTMKINLNLPVWSAFAQGVGLSFVFLFPMWIPILFSVVPEGPRPIQYVGILLLSLSACGFVFWNVTSENKVRPTDGMPLRFAILTTTIVALIYQAVFFTKQVEKMFPWLRDGHERVVDLFLFIAIALLTLLEIAVARENFVRPKDGETTGQGPRTEVSFTNPGWYYWWHALCVVFAGVFILIAYVSMPTFSDSRKDCEAALEEKIEQCSALSE
jgi:hypothetical protein